MVCSLSTGVNAGAMGLSFFGGEGIGLVFNPYPYAIVLASLALFLVLIRLEAHRSRDQKGETGYL